MRPVLSMISSWWSRLALVALWLVLLLVGCVPAPGVARSDGAGGTDLFVPVPSNRLSDATPAQTQRIAQLKARRTTAALELVRVNPAALRSARTRIAVPGGEAISLSGGSADATNADAFTWIGGTPGAPVAATLVVMDGNITGTVQRDGQIYRIEPVGGGVHAVVKLDPSRFPPDHPPNAAPLEGLGAGRSAPAPALDGSASDGPVGIDVLVAYTPSARTSVADINATVLLAVAEANQSYVNSGVNIRLNLVSLFEVGYTEAGRTYEQILDDFAGMADVRSRRDASGADMAVMLIDQSDFCGLARAIRSDAANAFAIVHYDCATGYYSFAHELGHLQGARHDPGTDATSTPFAYGHGFRHTTAPSWRTIMAYNCSGGCPRVQYWSSPNVTYSGATTGTADLNDNARVLNGTAMEVAAFRSRSSTPTPLVVPADVSRCPWYDKCGLTLARGCSICPDGFTNNGCTCSR